MARLKAHLALLLLFFSCPIGRSLGKDGGDKNKPSNDSSSQIQTRVYARQQCILSEEKNITKPAPELFGALAAIFVPFLIEKALGGVSSALKKAGSEETLKDSGKLLTYLYQLSNGKDKNLSLNPDLGCVLVVRGRFSGPDPDDQSKMGFPKEGIFLGTDQESDRVARLVASNIPVVEVSALYEAAIKSSNDHTAIYYEGRFLEVNGFQGTRSSDTRAFVVSISISAAGAKEDDSTVSLALLNLGETKRGGIMGPSQLRSQRSSWLGGLGINDASLKAIEKTEIKSGTSVGVMPITIEGTFIETEKGNKALLFIADVLAATKTDVSKAISGDILKDRAKEAATQVDALEKLRDDEETAYGAYLAALAALAKLESPTAEEKKIKEFDVERTKRVWCLKFKALDKIGQAPGGRPGCP